MDPKEKTFELQSTNVSLPTVNNDNCTKVCLQHLWNVVCLVPLVHSLHLTNDSSYILTFYLVQITFTNIVSVDERLTYKPHPEDKEK